MKLTAVLLDLDDTLVEERAYFMSGAAAVGRWVGAERAVLEDAIGARTGFLNRIPSPIGVAPEAWRDALLLRYRTHRPSISMFDDVPAFIAACRARGWQLGLVTDGKSAVQSRKVEALGLAFDVVVCTDDIDAPKPSHRPFAAAAALLGVPPASCAYLADDPSKDFIGPRALGMRTIQVRRPLPAPLARPSPGPHADPGAVADGLGEAFTLLVGADS